MADSYGIGHFFCSKNILITCYLLRLGVQIVNILFRFMLDKHPPCPTTVYNYTIFNLFEKTPLLVIVMNMPALAQKDLL